MCQRHRCGRPANHDPVHPCPSTWPLPPSPPACSRRSGADPGVRNHNNDTPGELAEALGLEEVASLLRQRQQLKRLMSSTSGRRLNHSLSSRSSPAVDGEHSPGVRQGRGRGSWCGGCAVQLS